MRSPEPGERAMAQPNNANPLSFCLLRLEDLTGTEPADLETISREPWKAAFQATPSPGNPFVDDPLVHLVWAQNFYSHS